MTTTINVHHLTREVFDTLPGEEHTAEAGYAWWKVIRLTDDAELTVYTWEPAVTEADRDEAANEHYNDMLLADAAAAQRGV